MISSLIRGVVRGAWRLLSRILGFTTAMALGPGLLLFIYLYEPQTPLPNLLSDLPRGDTAASAALEHRAAGTFPTGSSAADVVAYLDTHGFAVDTTAREATYTRRQLNCVEHYTLGWSEFGGRMRGVDARVETLCENPI